MQLNYHVPEQNEITLGDSEDLSALLEREGISITMFTEWFELNKKYPKAREYTYAEILQHYVWHAKDKKWKPRKQKKCIGRIVYSTPASGERYFLRMLLNDVRGARSFTELKMVNKINYATFKAACFVENWVRLSEDIIDKKQKHYRYPELNLSDEQVRNYCLLEIQDLLNTHGKSLTDFQDLPQPNPKLLTNMDNRLLREAPSFDANKSIASLLLPAGRTAHSRFVIPLELMENSTRDGCWPWVMGNYQIKKESEDEPTWIEIPEEFLIKLWTPPIEQMCRICIRFSHEATELMVYIKERSILTLRNDDADAINENMFKKLGGALVTYNSADKP
ncbi:ATP-dependent DNA helicase PIF1-like protein [Tanacetum coccineum]